LVIYRVGYAHPIVLIDISEKFMSKAGLACPTIVLGDV
jgi:hypothetical protein